MAGLLESGDAETAATWVVNAAGEAEGEDGGVALTGTEKALTSALQVIQPVGVIVAAIVLLVGYLRSTTAAERVNCAAYEWVADHVQNEQAQVLIMVILRELQGGGYGWEPLLDTGGLDTPFEMLPLIYRIPNCGGYAAPPVVGDLTDGPISFNPDLTTGIPSLADDVDQVMPTPPDSPAATAAASQSELMGLAFAVGAGAAVLGLVLLLAWGLKAASGSPA